MFNLVVISAALAQLGEMQANGAPQFHGLLSAESRYSYDHDDDDHDAKRLGRDGWFIQLGAGLTTTADSDGPDEDVEFDEGWAIPVALGHRFGGDDDNALAFDLELEGIYSDQDAGELDAVSDITVFGGLVNGVGEFAVGDTIGIYAGAGIGAAMLDVGTTDDGISDFEEEDGPFMTWQLKAGLRLWASEDVAWSLGYRFMNVDDAEIDDDAGNADFDLQTEQHILEIGLRFSL